MDSGTAQDLFDLSRGRQALLSVAQPGIGALLALGALPDSRTLILGLTAAVAGYLAVFSLNDVLDLRSDVEALGAGKGEFVGFDMDTVYSRHPIAAGRLRLRLAWLWVSSLAVVASIFAWLLNPWCVVVFGVSIGLEGVYCALRSTTWLKTIVSGLMVGVGGLAGWVAVAPLDYPAIGFFLFLAFWEVAGRNLPNDLSDIEADSAVNLKTVATTFGPSASGKAIAVGVVATVAALPSMALAPVPLAASLVATLLLMASPAVSVLRTPTPLVAARYFNRASLLPAVVFLVIVGSLTMGTP